MASNPRNESSQYTGGAGQALSPVQERNHRKSDRVFLTLPIRVSGVRGQGKDFSEEGQTIDISRQGATIKVDRDLFAGEIIKIERLEPLPFCQLHRVARWSWQKGNGSSRRPRCGGTRGLCIWGDDARRCHC